MINRLNRNLVTDVKKILPPPLPCKQYEREGDYFPNPGAKAALLCVGAAQDNGIHWKGWSPVINSATRRRIFS